MAVYIVAIYEAHYLNLKLLANSKVIDTCEDHKYDFASIWTFLELLIFYCYILTVIIFIMVCQC